MPDVRKEQAARVEHASSLPKPLHLVREKHEAELTDDDVE